MECGICYDENRHQLYSKPGKNLAGFLFGLEVTDCDLKWGGSKYVSMAFTEHGVAMLSSVLKKDQYTISFS